MGFKINNVEPTSIKYEGTEVTHVGVVSNGTATLVWGKPYNLVIALGSNVSVTVNRTASIYQGAATGALSNGSIVYHGDILEISATASTNYKVSSFTVNGTEWTNGNTLTVVSGVSIAASAVEDVYWRTVWSGSTDVGIGEPGSTTAGLQSTSKSVTFSGVLANKPTRITFASVNIKQRADGTDKGNWSKSPNEALNTACGYYGTSSTTNAAVSGQSNGYAPVSDKYCSVMIDTPTSANTLNVRFQFYVEVSTSWFQKKYGRTWYSSCVISKIEQYY